MLYYLFEWLHKLNFPGAGMFGYTSFRALMAVILALLISSIWGDKFINLLKKKQITETQRDAKTDPFGVNKVGVPSMGGVIIIVAILIPVGGIWSSRIIGQKRGRCTSCAQYAPSGSRTFRCHPFSERGNGHR